jgi:transcriptional regulator with XRE-family HTH domain
MVTCPPSHLLLAMDFQDRLTALRKERKLTQQALADHVGVHISQIRRYEAGESQPTLDVIRKLAIALSVSADVLVFDSAERGPGDDLRLQFEAVNEFSDEEKRTVRDLLEGMILKHQARRWDSARTPAAPSKKIAPKRGAPARAAR